MRDENPSPGMGKWFGDRREVEGAKPSAACLPAAGRVYRVKRTDTSYPVFYLKDKVKVKDRGLEEKIVERLMDRPDKQV